MAWFPPPHIPISGGFLGFLAGSCWMPSLRPRFSTRDYHPVGRTIPRNISFHASKISIRNATICQNGRRSRRSQRPEKQSGGDLRLMRSFGLLRVGRPAVAGVGRDRLGDTGVEVGHAIDEGTLGGDV